LTLSETSLYFAGKILEGMAYRRMKEMGYDLSVGPSYRNTNWILKQHSPLSSFSGKFMTLFESNRPASQKESRCSI
jgi:hypothetical protein